MKARVPLVGVLAISAAVSAEPAADPEVRVHRFTGASAMHDLCGCLLEARAAAESQGRLDFAVDVTFAASDPFDVTARIHMGSAHVVGRITFAGNSSVNDWTLRRAVRLYEREVFDVGKLRQSLSRINDLGVFEPLTLTDVIVDARDDGVTADLTVPLRERRRRWWSLAGSPIPGVRSFEASIGSRLPPWGRGVFEASTYVVRLNVLGMFMPASKVWPLVLERPLVPGQEWLSGFALSSSPGAMLTHYGRTHAVRGVHRLLDMGATDVLAVPVAPGAVPNDLVVCQPPRPRLWWLRRGGTIAADLLIGALP